MSQLEFAAGIIPTAGRGQGWAKALQLPTNPFKTHAEHYWFKSC
jgi:hypothetical protein